MRKHKPNDSSASLLNAIIEGILEKKGLDIVSLHLEKVHSTVCDYFVVCHGTSRTHVAAIADSVEDVVRKQAGVKPWRREGSSNAEWILLDYLDIVVHVFQEPVRNYFQIEQLWADAPLTKH